MRTLELLPPFNACVTDEERRIIGLVKQAKAMRFAVLEIRITDGRLIAADLKQKIKL